VLVIVAGLRLFPPYVFEIIIVIGVLVSLFAWIKGCSPSRCQVLRKILAGLAIGAAILAILVLAGAAPLGFPTLIAVALLLGLIIGLGVRWRCF
jgi:hypothetical protein